MFVEPASPTELDWLFNPKSLEQGFSLSFGDNLEALEAVIDSLDLDESLRDGSLSISDLVVAGGNSAYYRGPLKKRLCGMRLLEGLAVLEDDFVSRNEDLPSLSTLASREVVSRIVLIEEPKTQDQKLAIILEKKTFSRYIFGVLIDSSLESTYTLHAGTLAPRLLLGKDREIVALDRAEQYEFSTEVLEVI